MTEKEKIEQLQSIIKEGLGDRTQKAFAIEVGLTQEHVSRLMAKGYKVKPSQRVLIALASGLTNTSKEELFNLFEYEDDEQELTVSEYNVLAFHQLKDVVSKILSNKKIFTHSDEFAEEIVNTMSYHGFKLKKKSLRKHVPETGVENELFSFEYIREKCVGTLFLGIQYYFAVLREEDVTNRVMISKVAFSKEDLEELKFAPQNLTTKYPFASSLVKFADKKILKEKNNSYAKVVTYGYGFKLNNLSRRKLDDFFLKYLKVNSENIVDVKNGISEIMRERVRLNFELVHGDGSSSIMLVQNELSEMEAEIIKGFAKELGLKSWGYIREISTQKIKDEIEYVLE